MAERSDLSSFVLGRSRYDQSTFSGRYRHFLDIVDPRTLFVSDAKLKQYCQLLDKFKYHENLPHGTTAEDLWQAQKAKDAILHPDTGEKMLMPFRMSGFAPFGSWIVLGLLVPHTSIYQTIFWQWINQSHNAAVNYANRNATKPVDRKKLASSYFLAVGAACSIAVSLSVLVKRADSMSKAAKILIQKFIPFPAVACASVSNVLFMRWSERQEGIEVFEDGGKVVGTSRIAANKALKEMAISRAVLPAPLLLIPPVCMTLLEKIKRIKTSPRLNLGIHFSLVLLSFFFGLPLAISLFPQVSKIKAGQLEAEIQAQTSDENIYYNKGL